MVIFVHVKKSIFFILFVLFPLAEVYPQLDTVNQVYTTFSVKSGFLVAHHSTMAHLPKSNITAFELGFHKPLSLKKAWHSWYKKPIVSFNLYASNLANNAILGQAIGSYCSIGFPFARSRNHFLLGRLGAGLGYLTKHFDQHSNQKNVAIGTHVNALIQLGLRGVFQMNKSNQLIYQLDLTHFSNGAYRVPNLGLNMFFVGLGFAHSFSTKRITSKSGLDVFPRNKYWYGNVTGIFSHKEIYPTGRVGKPVYALSISAKRIGLKKAGVEFALDVISKQILFEYKSYVPKTQLSILQMGFYTGYILPLDQLHFILGMGVYFKDRYNPDDALYHRVGMRYCFKNGITLNLLLKSHWAKADYVEYGLGYNFQLKRFKK